MQLKEIKTNQPCTLCKERAVYQATIREQGIVVQPILCNSCANLPDSVVVDAIVNYQIKKED